MKIFEAKGHSDMIAVEHQKNRKQLFFTVNGQHVGFLSHEDSEQLAKKIMNALKGETLSQPAKPKPEAETKPKK